MLAVFSFLSTIYTVVFYGTLILFCFTLPILFLTPRASPKRIFFYATSLMLVELFAVGFIYFLARGVLVYFITLDSAFFLSFVVFIFLFFANVVLLFSFYLDKQKALVAIAAYKRLEAKKKKEKASQPTVEPVVQKTTEVVIERPVGVGVRTPFGGFLDTPPPEPTLPSILSKTTDTKSD